MSVSRLNDAEHWRQEATKLRSLSADMNDILVRGRMLQLAQDYDLLAYRAQERATRMAQSKDPIMQKLNSI